MLNHTLFMPIMDHWLKTTSKTKTDVEIQVNIFTNDLSIYLSQNDLYILSQI